MDRLVEGGLVAGVTPVASASAGAHAFPAAAVATPSPASTNAPAGEQDWRFDMRQDGTAMTADVLAAWMAETRSRVAIGHAGQPDPYRCGKYDEPRVGGEWVRTGRSGGAP